MKKIKKKEKTPQDLEPQKQLESWTILDDFKRIMFHTYSDFRDLCLGKDIGNDVGNGKTNIDRIFSKNNQTIEPEIWWKTIEKDIGEAMFCVLSYDTPKKKKKFKKVFATNLPKTSPINTKMWYLMVI